MFDFLQACQTPDHDGDSWNASASTTMTIPSPVKSFEGSSETGRLMSQLQKVTYGLMGQGAFSGTEDLQLGMLAAIYTYDEVSRPWLGEVQTIEDGDTVKIHWYMGGYPKSWKPMSGTNSTSSVHRESLLLWGFTLTEKSQRLTSETAAELKRLYQETDDRMTIQQDRISEELN
ncbi:unnamed protein product [Darwinula stevensoni]|uniref:Uncharacterized protein n=1 Tax=Darwinula stevensoni TaxID=69355 RepID=A0A7R9AEG5_9CRUS|nr:unnamed protein product [Darwinula stevensoni]CAG0902375.1 unnamed protein product [Darwinula stevensoni]